MQIIQTSSLRGRAISRRKRSQRRCSWPTCTRQHPSFSVLLQHLVRYCDDATLNREQVFRLLKIGLVGRQKIVAAHKELSAHKQRLEEQPKKKSQGAGQRQGPPKAGEKRAAARGGGACGRKQSKTEVGTGRQSAGSVTEATSSARTRRPTRAFRTAQSLRIAASA